MKGVIASVVFLLAAVAPAQVTTITPGGLGYPVPFPVDSPAPVDGFRSYDALLQRFLELSLTSPYITAQNTGNSIEGRPITSYRFSSLLATTPEGGAKSAAFVQGTIHAREWASPEVVAAVFEWLAIGGGTDPVAAYLLENTETLIRPIANPDGFVQSQRYPNQTVGGGATGYSGHDGRMRRKNMRDVDTVLETITDASLGVDLNRNLPVGFGENGGSSSSPTSQSYRGPAPFSEVESLALEASLDMIDRNRLRFAIDFHSHQQAFYVITGSSGQQTAARLNYRLMRDAIISVSGINYSELLTEVEDESIGATDEYFTGTFGAMAYTCEIRPNFGTNGFILPESQVALVREEMVAAVRSGLYYAAGPPVLRRVDVYRIPDGQFASRSPLLFSFVREYDNSTQTRFTRWENPAGEALLPGHRYALALRFSKPMRVPGDSGPLQFPGATSDAADASAAEIGFDAYTWSFTMDGPVACLRYPGDTLWVRGLVNPDALPGSKSLGIDVADLVGMRLDAFPHTPADWSAAGWLGWENSEGSPGQTGGRDRQDLFLPVAPSPDNGATWIVE